MCFYLARSTCPGCVRQIEPSFQRCHEEAGPFHQTPTILTVVDLIRTNSYFCPAADCELNGEIHHSLFDLQVDAATQNQSFLQDGLSFLPYDAYRVDAADEEACDLAFSDSEDTMPVYIGSNIDEEACDLALSDTEDTTYQGDNDEEACDLALSDSEDADNGNTVSARRATRVTRGPVKTVRFDESVQYYRENQTALGSVSTMNTGRLRTQPRKRKGSKSNFKSSILRRNPRRSQRNRS